MVLPKTKTLKFCCGMPRMWNKSGLCSNLRPVSLRSCILKSKSLLSSTAQRHITVSRRTSIARTLRVLSVFRTRPTCYLGLRLHSPHAHTASRPLVSLDSFIWLCRRGTRYLYSVPRLAWSCCTPPRSSNGLPLTTCVAPCSFQQVHARVRNPGSRLLPRDSLS